MFIASLHSHVSHCDACDIFGSRKEPQRSPFNPVGREATRLSITGVCLGYSSYRDAESRQGELSFQDPLRPLRR